MDLWLIVPLAVIFVVVLFLTVARLESGDERRESRETREWLAGVMAKKAEEGRRERMAKFGPLFGLQNQAPVVGDRTSKQMKSYVRWLEENALSTPYVMDAVQGATVQDSGWDSDEQEEGRQS